MEFERTEPDEQPQDPASPGHGHPPELRGPSWPERARAVAAGARKRAAHGARRIPWRGLAEAGGLALALLFVFSMQFIPHLDTFRDPPAPWEDGLEGLYTASVSYVEGDREGFGWALHVDEHIHMNYVEKVQRWDQAFVGDAYGEAPPESQGILSLRGSVHERGYHIILAQAQELTGLSTYHTYLYLPALWMTFVAFSVFALLRPHPGAVPAAFFVGLIPTTVRFLGPAFLVPIGFVLAWLPIVAMLSEPAKKRASAAALLLAITAWAFFVHLIGGFAAVAILGLGALLSTGRSRRAALTFLLLSLLPVVWLWRTFQAGVQAELQREEALPIDLSVFETYGLFALFLWGIGLLLMTLDPPEGDRGPVVAFSALGVFAFSLIIGGLVLDLGKYATYARWHPPFFLAAAVPAGYAVGELGKWSHRGLRQAIDKLPRGKRLVRPVAPLVAVVLMIVLAGSVVSLPQQGSPVDRHMEEPFYHVMDQRTWDAFLWVEDNVAGGPYEVFLSHPWRAPFLAEMAAKDPHAIMRPGAPPTNDADYRAYLGNRSELEMYVMNDITLVVGPHAPPGDVWTKIGPDTYAMDQQVAQEIAQIRAAERARR